MLVRDEILAYLRATILGITFIFLLLLAGCGGKREDENKDVAELRTIPAYQLPAKFDSDRKVKYKAIELPNNDLIKELQTKKYFTLLGKVFETKHTITILGYIADDYGTPTLITFDSQGKKISSHGLFENAVADMGRYTSNMTTLLANKQILFTDSTITRKINPEGTDEIPGTDSLSVTRKKYRITDEGLVERIE